MLVIHPDVKLDILAMEFVEKWYGAEIGVITVNYGDVGIAFKDVYRTRQYLSDGRRVRVDRFGVQGTAFVVLERLVEAQCMEGKTINAYVGVIATHEYGDCPRYARFEIDQSFVNRLYGAKARCLDGVRSITVDDGPEWCDETDLRLRNDGLVVSDYGFFFKAYPKHCDYDVETRYIYFSHFESEVAKALNEGVTEIYFEGITKDEIAVVAPMEDSTA